MKIEVSNGEILDKISILMIKLEKISDKKKLVNISNELEELKCSLNIEDPIIHNVLNELKDINTQLWDIENKIRQKEKEKSFDDEFISLARLIYITNDKRSEIKKKVNEKTNSKIVEEKSYEKYE